MSVQVRLLVECFAASGDGTGELLTPHVVHLFPVLVEQTVTREAGLAITAGELGSACARIGFWSGSLVVALAGIGGVIGSSSRGPGSGRSTRADGG